MLLTVETYRVITGDSTSASAEVERAASAAQELLEDKLGRRDKLELEERTEVCPYEADGTIYPQATPVISAGDLDVFDDTVYGSTPDSDVFRGVFEHTTPKVVTLTYVGGYSAATAPRYMLTDLAWCAFALLRPENRQLLASVAGAEAAQLGDASVRWGSGGAPAPADVVASWSDETLRHRRRL